MPQGPLASNVAVRPLTGGGSRYAPLQQDISGNTLTGLGISSSLNVTATTVIKAAPGRVAKVSVTVAGSAPGNLYDKVNATGLSAATLVYVIPNTVGIYTIDWPCAAGIVVAPGAGQTVAISYV